MSATEEEVTEWRESWASRGVELRDWNLAYYLSVADEEDAKNLIEELKQDENVEYDILSGKRHDTGFERRAGIFEVGIARGAWC